MKKIYSTPDVVFVQLSSTDVIATSVNSLGLHDKDYQGNDVTIGATETYY